ncbi:LysR family transcriptional regulator [Methyloraptor flagellatus]|uniref:LysR family transcriptional regulator n=1 Tax=Methyloraptor flagellatus TaxID=3162530 RepID=A0AAU7X734_9HYPH
MRQEAAVLSNAYRYFLAVAEAGSIRAAARELNIVSSAVNRQILLLEDQLGIRLFDRVGRGLRLSEAGQVLVRQLRATLVHVGDAVAELDALRGLKRGRVRIATVESVSVERLPRLLAAFWQRYPGIEIAIAVAGSEAVERMVEAGDVDIGFTFNPREDEAFEAVFAEAHRIGALVAPGHRLATRSGIAIADLAGEPLAVPAKGLSLREALDPALARHAGTLTVRVEADSLRLMSTLARDGVAVAFHTPVGIERELAAGSLALLPIEDADVALDRLVVIRLKARTPSLALAAFADFLEEVWSTARSGDGATAEATASRV